MKRLSRLFVVTPILLIAVVFVSIAYAQSDSRANRDSCSAPDVQTGVRPDKEGTPTRVSIGLRLVDLMEINDVGQTLTGDFAVFLTWRDQRLAGLEGCRISLNDIWSPGVLFLNSGRLFPNRPAEVSIGPAGSVRYVQRYYGTLATYHHLHDFPFDKQIFHIWLFPGEYGEKEVEFIVDERATGRRERLNISNWEVNEVKGVINREYAHSLDQFHSIYDFEIYANRITAYYVWKVILPLCLIVAMSWVVFWINPAQFGPQIGLSATSMLTLIAFLFATTNMLPELGYFTVLDQFIGGSTILVFLALLESLSSAYLFSEGKEKISMRIDHVSRIGFPVAFLLLMVFVF